MTTHDVQSPSEASVHATTTVETRPLRILSLDGGGVRGLSSLLILRRIMHNVRPSNNLYDIAKPCEYFDMICGTSTGGLIAIMLGRLQMGVQEAIDAYVDLAKKVFREPHIRIFGSRTIGAILGNARFSGDDLSDAIKDIVESKTKNKQTSLLDGTINTCKVFVCATRTANTEPAFLRSYSSDKEEGCHATIWEAARATSAAPTFFPSIKFGNPPAEYVDGAIGHNNPIRLLMREVESVWGSSARLGCILSIGTGLAREPARLGSKGHKVLLACKDLATSADNIARDFYKDQGEKLEKEGKYFRFNVVRGLHGVSLEEWQKFEAMDAATKMYLEDVKDSIQTCSDRLRNPNMNGTTSPIVSPFRHASGWDLTATATFDVPYNSSPHFTGRANYMTTIDEHFRERNPPNPRTAVLSGLGGVGKTQIALNYFEKHKSNYTSAIFVQCSSEQEAVAAYVRFAGFVVDEELRTTPSSDYDDVAKQLGFSGLLTEHHAQLSKAAHKRVVKAVGIWLGRQPGRFLIILDNADDPIAIGINNFIPQYPNGDIIITTRDARAAALGRLIEIEEMSVEEATTLLSQASHIKLDTPELTKAAREITETLGYLPLAIDQACGYLVASETDICNFLSAYKLHYISVLSRIPNDGMLGYKKSALTTWEMSFGRLEAESPKSALLLQHLGFMHCKDICKDLFYLDNKSPINSWGPHWDSFRFDDTFELFCKLSLMRRNKNAGTYEIHKVVHLWIKERLNSTDRALFGREAIVSVSKSLASVDQRSPQQARKIHRRLYPHIEAAWNNVQEHTSFEEDGQHHGFIEALKIVCNSFQTQGYFDTAEKGFLRVYHACSITCGTEASETLHAAVDLATIYKSEGKSTEAERYLRLAVKGFAVVFGQEHESTLEACHNLASVLHYKGETKEAIILFEQALEGRQKRYGVEGLETLDTMDSLASVNHDTEQYVKAQPLLTFVFEARKRLLGPGHADTIRAALKMGLLHSKMGKQQQALKLFDMVYESRGTLLKSQSPEACNALSLIAALYANVGHMKKSEMLYRAVFSSQEEVLGPQHADTLWALNHLSVIIFSRERSETAVQNVEKSAKDLENVLGEKNLDTLWVFHNLAMIYAFLGRSEPAIQLQERVVQGYISEVGAGHINTLYMVNDLGDCYLRAGKYLKAEETIRRAYEGKKKRFGSRSQYTLYSAALLACSLKELGRHAEAEEMYTKTFETTLDTLGFDHSAVWWIAGYLAEFYVESRRWQDAKNLYKQLVDTKTAFLGESHASAVHDIELLGAVEKQMSLPPATPLDTRLLRPTRSLPSDFGYRVRNDIVQILF